MGEAGEKLGDWGLKMSDIRSNGLKPLRPDEVGGCRRRPDRGVEYPDNPVGIGAPVCRLRCPSNLPEDFLEDRTGPVEPVRNGNCDFGLGVSVAVVVEDRGGVEPPCCCWIIRGDVGFGIGIACCLLGLGLTPIVVSRGGVGFDLRRDGVKNNRLFPSFLGVSLSFGTGAKEALAVVVSEPNSRMFGVCVFATLGSREPRGATATDGGVESVANAIVEATSNGDML